VSFGVVVLRLRVVVESAAVCGEIVGGHRDFVVDSLPGDLARLGVWIIDGGTHHAWVGFSDDRSRDGFSQGEP
jgi:hypothetical protein